MSLINFFARRKALTATPAVLEALQDRRVSFLPALGGTNLNANRRVDSAYVEVQNASYAWLFATVPAIRAVIDYIASNIAMLGCRVYERVSDDEREHRGDHPAAVMLREPNPHTPGEQFIYTLVSDFLTFDNAYAVKMRGDNGRLVLMSVVPHMVGLIGQAHFTVEGYRIFRRDGTYLDVRPEDMLHWRGYNPNDPRKGESKLETLRQEIAADIAARQASTELYRSGLALPGWITRPMDAPEWTDNARRRFQADMSAQARDARRHFPVFEEGMELHTGGVTPEDAEMIAARRWTAEQTAAQFGMRNVPPQDEAERWQFYADVLPPLCDRLASFLNLQVLRQEYDDADDFYVEFSLDEKLSGDDRLRALTSAAGAPVMLRNEARARLNLPAVEGGDELVTPLNVLVGNPSKPSVDVMPVQDANKPSQEGDHREEEEAAPTPPAPKSLNGNGNGHGDAAAVAEVLRKHFAYQRKRRTEGRALDAPRQTKRLALALEGVAPGRDYHEVALNINRDSERDGDLSEERAAELAKLVTGSELRKLADLGVPEQFLWERAGLTPDEIDRARAMKLADDLLADASP